MPNNLGIDERLARKMSRPARVRSVAIRFTEDECSRLAAAAQNRGVALREWARDVLLDSVSRPQTDVAVFTELTALRLLLTNVLRPLALGETLTPERFQAILSGVRRDKHDAAHDLLLQYQPNGKKEQ